VVGYDGGQNVRDKERRVVTETDPPSGIRAQSKIGGTLERLGANLVESPFYEVG